MTLMWKLCLLVGYLFQLCLNSGSPAPVVLAGQEGDKVTPIDTLLPNHVGCLSFEGATPLAPGQYLFVQDGRRLFNFLISSTEKQEMSFTATVANGGVQDIQITGSEENNAYMRFYQYLQEQYYRIDHLMEEYPDTLQALEQVARLEATSREYTDFLSERFQGQMLGIITRNVFTPQVTPNTAVLHYLDYVDFSDPRLVRTSILPLRLNEYFSQVVPPVADSLIFHIDRILNQESIDPEVKTYCARYLFTHFFSSPVMGMETVAVHIARNYFLNHVVEWSNPAELQELENYVAFNSQCLMGMEAPELSLPDRNGTAVSLHQQTAPYTLVFFFEEGCPLCSSQILELKAFYDSYTGPRLHVYAVYTQDKEEVLERYADYFPADWSVVWDPGFTADFPHKYNVRSTPKMFLLDSQKRIIGRDITTSTVQEILRDRAARTTSAPADTRPAVSNVFLETENGESFALYDVEAAHTIVLFYDPACVMCGAVTHAVYQLYLQHKDKDLKVLAVYTGSDYASWRLWLEEAGYTQWINVWNPSADDRLHQAFQIGPPPAIFLLNKDRQLDAERLSIDDLSYIINNLI